MTPLTTQTHMQLPEIRFSRQEYLDRLQRVQIALETRGLDALIAYSVRNAPGPVTFLAGYESTLGLHDVSIFVFVPGGAPSHLLLTNAFWDDHAQRTWVEDVLITSEFGAAIAKFLPAFVERVGIAGLQFFPAPIFTDLTHRLPQTSFVDATKLLMETARCKSPTEIQAVRAAVKITDAGGHAFLNSVREGATEREIKTEVERAIMLAGSDTIWYGYQLSSGPDAQRGMGQMTGRDVQRGEQVQVDCGAVYQGYHADFSRVTTVGAVSKATTELMETTAQMYEAMLACLEPGVPISVVADAGIGVARQAGMEDYLFRSPNQATRLMGHGIGCWYLEVPEVTPATTGVIEPNMVVVLEPILSRPGIAGAKIEDAVLVTETGAERLSEIPLRTW